MVYRRSVICSISRSPDFPDRHLEVVLTFLFFQTQQERDPGAHARSRPRVRLRDPRRVHLGPRHFRPDASVRG
jgi:hypothetical protein